MKMLLCKHTHTHTVHSCRGSSVSPAAGVLMPRGFPSVQLSNVAREASGCRVPITGIATSLLECPGAWLDSPGCSWTE